MEFLRRCWMPLAWSRAVGRRPCAVHVLGTRLVAFRDRAGHATVLEDRCAHRGVALSEGRVMGDCIECPYHGWRFDTAGRCTHVPSLLRNEKVPDYRVPSYRTQEQDGILWFALDDAVWPAEPPRWRHPDAMSSQSVVELEGNYLHLLENLVDNPHAGFIHAGLIRNEPTQRVCAEITETTLQIQIRTRGEKTNDSLLFKLLGKRGEEVHHLEEYRAPSEMMSTYSQRGRVAGVQSFIVPIDEHRTRWFFRIFLQFGAMTAVVFPVYRRIVLGILRQDAAVVRKIHAQSTLWPNRRACSTRSDVPSTLVARAARAFAEAGPSTPRDEHVRTIEYLL